MNLTLKRLRYEPHGVYSRLSGDSIDLYTIEHAYSILGGVCAPKLSQGVYTCKRGMHKLRTNIPFETFEVLSVPGHTGILFHKGNTQADSDGCVLLGCELDMENKMIKNSLLAFDQFMQAQIDDDEFQLTVED